MRWKNYFKKGLDICGFIVYNVRIEIEKSIMNLNINDVCALKELLTQVVRREYDSIDDKVANALLGAMTKEYAVFTTRLERETVADAILNGKCLRNRL
tara:strand:+ start:219 stop:512 length:294 start_codon:yes stop_codon:yes gene_type:complete